MAANDKGQPKEKQDRTQPSRAGGSSTAPYRHGALTPIGVWDPFRRMREDFNQLANQFFGGWPMLSEPTGRDWRWNLDVREEESNVMVRAEAPGFEAGDFDIQVQGDQLVLSAEHKGESEEKERGFHEWRQQEYYRSVTRPSGIDANKVAANYRNGILTITLPKTEEGKGRRITVES